MKHLTRMAFLSALALAAVVSCQREPQVPDNPTYDSKSNTVKTTLVLDISTGTGKDTKITANYAQCNNNFLGMSEVHLLAYNLDYLPAKADSGHFYFNVGAIASRDYNLGDLFDAGGAEGDHTSRSVELALPLETNAVCLYGKATKTTSNDVQGYTYASTTNPLDLGDVSFTLYPRLSSKEAYVAGTVVFSNILNGFLVAGLIPEANIYAADDPDHASAPVVSAYWRAATGNAQVPYVSAPTGKVDRRYRFWWPETGNISSGETVPSANLTKSDGSAYVDGDEITFGGRVWILHTGSLTWKQLGKMYEYESDKDNGTSSSDVISGFPFNTLAESLGETYYRLANVKSQVTSTVTLKELRAGGAGALLRTCSDLYAIVSKAATTQASSWDAEVVRLLASEITRRIRLYFTYSGNSLTGWQTAEVILGMLEANMASTEWDKYKNELNLFDDNYLSDATGAGGFPLNVGLPQGAAIVLCNRYTNIEQINVLDQFEYTSDIPAYGMGENATFPIYNYRYPAELMYYGNSPIRVSNQAVTADSYPVSDGTNDKWSWDSKWKVDGWVKNGSVSSTTRSVALTKCINYGTALLKSNVMYSSGALANGLQDNKKEIYGEDNNVIPVPGTSSTGIKVTGIVVGGQPETVCWDFTRKPVSLASTGFYYDHSEKVYKGLVFDDGTSDTAAGYVEAEHRNLFNKMIYDKVSPSFRIGDALADNSIYTLCWDNYDATLAADEQSDVYVALELVNNTGRDFWGELNMVRNGGTFYLVGKLDLKALKAHAATEGGKDDRYNSLKNLSRSDYFYPPFDPQTGATINAPRVLMQDYMTVANLIIGETSLQHAYVTVPDLRASQVSLGVSIDLHWEPGLEFNVNMGVL